MSIMYLDFWGDKFGATTYYHGPRIGLCIGICWCAESWLHPLLAIDFMCWSLEIGWTPTRHDWAQCEIKDKEKSGGKAT